MLHIYICEDEKVQLNRIRDMITEYIADLRIDAGLQQQGRIRRRLWQSCMIIVNLPSSL